MKIEHKKWLSISIFIPKCEWHLVIANAIKPLIFQLYKNETLFASRLGFNNELGENIRLSLHVSYENKHDVALKVDAYFRDFFKRKQLLPTEKVTSNISLFMPFFNNTIAYGLYTVDFDRDHRYISALEDVLSEAILEALADCVIDDEITLTFALYVLLSCYKIVRTNPFTNNKWRTYYEYVTDNLKSSEFTDQFIEENYELTKAMADEIFLDTLDSPSSSDQPWIKKWENTFSKTWLKIKKDENVAVFFAQVNDIINRQLALNLMSQLLLSAILNKTITRND